MNMNTTLLRPFALAVFLMVASMANAAIPPAENLLPSDTLAFFTVPDCNALRADAKTSPQMMFWNDPAMKPFHDKFMAAWNNKFIAPLERDLGVKAANFEALPQGQFTLAVTVNGSTGHDDTPPGLLLLLDAKGKSDQLKTNLAALTKKWAAAGRALRTQTFHGIAFTVVPLNSNDFSGLLPQRAPVSEIGKEPKPDNPGVIYLAQFQSLLIAGNSPKAVEPVAAHLTGGGVPAIADDSVFAADKLSQFRDKPLYYGWFNGRAFFDLITKAPDENSDDDAPSLMPRFSTAKIIGALGLGDLKSSSFALRETPAGSSLDLHLSAPESGRQGLLKILALPAKDANIPAFVPADSVKYSRLRLDGKKTWAELQKMIGTISPQGLAGLNSAIDMANTLAQQKNPGFDLRTALFGNLGDDFISYQKAPAGDSAAALANPPTLYLLAVQNPDQVIDAVKTIAAMTAPQNPAAKPRDFLGRKIFTVSLRATRDPATGAARRNSLYLSTSGGYLAMSSDTAILEEYLRSANGKVKPLRETAGLADAAQRVGGTGGGMFGYENQREAMRIAFKLLKSSDAAGNPFKMLPPAIRDWADFSLLPDYAQVQKYFYESVYAGNANAGGLTMKIFSPRPPQLN
jgi:hypothetical protein